MNFGKDEVRRILQSRNQAKKKFSNRLVLHVLKICFLLMVLFLVVDGVPDPVRVQPGSGGIQ